MEDYKTRFLLRCMKAFNSANRILASRTFLIQGIMKNYSYGEPDIVFDIDQLASKEPFGQFDAWFGEATKTFGIFDASKMTLSTATSSGQPSSRIVLLRHADERGIVFRTSYLSRKGQELTENPQASMLFHWSGPSEACHLQSRQVRIEGKVEKISEAEAIQQFHAEDRIDQIAALMSGTHFSLVESREELHRRKKDLYEVYADESVPVPKPELWGGYRLIPHFFEFWQAQSGRINDRIIFRKPAQGEIIDPKFTHQGKNGWVYERHLP